MNTDPSIAWVISYNAFEDRTEWVPVKRGPSLDGLRDRGQGHWIADEPDEARGLVRRDLYDKMVKA